MTKLEIVVELIVARIRITNNLVAPNDVSHYVSVAEEIIKQCEEPK